MKNRKKYLWIILLIGILSGCYKEENYVSKRETTETIEVVPDTKETTKKTGITTEQVNLRAKADVDSAVITQVPKATELEIISVEDIEGVSWSRVIIENSAGFIQSQYISSEE